jgi:O-succinylbenzoic acid--CoA ligase
MASQSPITAPQIRSELHGGRVVRCYHPRAAGVFDMFATAVAARPEAEALVFGAHRLTYAELDERVSRLADGLARRGLQPGDRLATLIGNRPEFVELFLACLRLGAVFVPLSVRDGPAGVAHSLADSGARILVYEAALSEKLAQLPGVEAPMRVLALGLYEAAFVHAGEQRRFTAIPLGAVEDPGVGYVGLLEHGRHGQPVTVGEAACCAILYTSGTTGNSKGVMLTNFGVVHSVMHYQQAMQLGPDERSVVAVPMSHVTGLVALVCTILGLGGTLIVMPAFNAGEYLDLASRERATHTLMVPAMFKLCLIHERFGDADLSAWRIGAYGGAVMPAAVISELAERLPDLALMNCYGATETTSPAVIMPLGEGLTRREYIGRTVACGEILIMDEDGLELPRGETGELWIAGPMITPGYWENPTATAGELVGGYWKSGDIGMMDEEGYIRILDRRKDVINRGGFKIFSAEVEAVLHTYPHVTEAAVVPKPCPVLGERVHAFIFADAPVKPAELRAHCSHDLADYAAPESFTFTTEPLPRNANGKIMKRLLREQV